MAEDWIQLEQDDKQWLMFITMKINQQQMREYLDCMTNYWIIKGKYLYN
jgi:hypothetical protein